MTQQSLFGNPPGTCPCNRCKVPCKVAPAHERNPEARFVRLAKAPKGLCLECAVAEFFLAYELRRNITDPKVLLSADIQRQFAAVLKAGFSDAARDAINWQRVVDNWHLPFPGDGKVRGLSTEKEQDRAATKVSLGAATPKLRIIRGGKTN